MNGSKWESILSARETTTGLVLAFALPLPHRVALPLVRQHLTSVCFQGQFFPLIEIEDHGWKRYDAIVLLGDACFIDHLSYW